MHVFIRYFHTALRFTQFRNTSGDVGHLSRFTALVTIAHDICHESAEGMAGPWSRFLRSIIAVDTELKFLTELLERCDDHQRMTSVVESCLVEGAYNEISSTQLQAARLLELSINLSDTKVFGRISKFFRKRIDPNVRDANSNTIAIRAAQEANDKLMIIHETFGDRYDPNIQDATGHTCLMYAVLN